MPLTLQQQFLKTTFRHVLLPALAIIVGSVAVFAAVLSHFNDRNQKRTLESFGRVLEQQLLMGDYSSLSFQLAGVAQTLNWHDAIVLTEDGRVVAAYPTQTKVHTRVLLADCRNTIALNHADGSTSGHVCWESSRWNALFPLLALAGLFSVIFGALATLNYLRIRRVLVRHGAELQWLSDELAAGRRQLPDFVPSSAEGEKLVKAIEAFDKAREQLTLAEAKKKRAEELAELAAKVAHDIRSPLAALTVAMDLGADKEQGRRELIRRSCERIEKIANDLLSQEQQLRAPVAGKTPVAAVALQVVEEKRLELSQRPQLEVVSSSTCGTSPLVHADSDKLSRILSNLLNNAAESMQGRSGTIGIAVESRGDWVQLRVHDQGCGIPAEVLPELGKRGATFGKVKGFGIGLADAKETIERWGGRLEIMSKAGRGTEVCLWLRQVPMVEGVLA